MTRDPGLPAERTSLAWQRTGVAASTGSALGLLTAAHDGRAWLVVVVALISAAGVGCVEAAGRSGRSSRSSRSGPADGSAWSRLLAAVAATLLLATTGVLLVLVSALG